MGPGSNFGQKKFNFFHFFNFFLGFSAFFALLGFFGGPLKFAKAFSGGPLLALVPKKKFFFRFSLKNTSVLFQEAFLDKKKLIFFSFFYVFFGIFSFFRTFGGFLGGR